MSATNKIVFLSGAFFLISALVLDEEGQESLREKLGLPSDFVASLFSDKSKGETVNEKVENSGFPTNRALTIDEMYDLALHVTSKYGFVSTSEPHLVTFAYIESAFLPYATRSESGGRQSIGLMQTLIGTAQDMYKKGYSALGLPTEESLKDPVVSMYFGAAYLDWLKRYYAKEAYAYGDYEEFFIRAYNGGPGWQNSEAGRNGTANYLKKWRLAKDKVGTRNMFFGV